MARPGFRTHPKFRRLIRLLGMPAPHVLGHVQCLWETGYETANPVIGDSTDIELAAEWEGEDGQLTRALLDVRLIDEVEPGVYAIHDLFDHAPDYVRKRAERRQATQNKKLQQKTADNVCRTADIGGQVRTGCPKTSAFPSPPIPSHPKYDDDGDTRAPEGRPRPTQPAVNDDMPSPSVAAAVVAVLREAGKPWADHLDDPDLTQPWSTAERWRIVIANAAARGDLRDRWKYAIGTLRKCQTLELSPEARRRANAAGARQREDQRQRSQAEELRRQRDQAKADETWYAALNAAEREELTAKALATLPNDEARATYRRSPSMLRRLVIANRNLGGREAPPDAA